MLGGNWGQESERASKDASLQAEGGRTGKLTDIKWSLSGVRSRGTDATKGQAVTGRGGARTGGAEADVMGDVMHGPEGTSAASAGFHANGWVVLPFSSPATRIPKVRWGLGGANPGWGKNKKSAASSKLGNGSGKKIGCILKIKDAK